MTSLLTNSSAMVALRTLSEINSNLDTTNNRVSTGLRISEARDSAAYWAIATTTASDNGALGTVKDALALGKATMEVVYNGLDTTRESLQKMKELLVAARQPGVDRANIQTEITGLITDLQNKAGASVINEQNFLKYDSTTNLTKSIVASFERSASAITVSTINLDLTTVILDDVNAANAGILDKTRNGGTTTATNYGGSIYGLNGTTVSALTDSANDLTKLDTMIKAVDTALTDVIGAQNLVGTVQSRAESQEKFIAALIDANKSAIGSLIDADMEQESTRMRALQTQQQLAVQALSVANGSSQNVLGLFR